MTGDFAALEPLAVSVAKLEGDLVRVLSRAERERGEGFCGATFRAKAPSSSSSSSSSSVPFAKPARDCDLISRTSCS